VQRGFEQHIHQIASRLHGVIDLTVLSGADLGKTPYRYKVVRNISRNSFWSRFLHLNPESRFRLEQMSFLIGMIPLLLKRKSAAFYLGEYQLYCYLFKLRSFLRLNYKLVLYTGGQAAPGLFDTSRDFVHHITNVYLPYTQSVGIPSDREFVVPHYVDCSFHIENEAVARIKGLAGGRKIILSVGIIDQQIKRMDLIPELLSEVRENVFVILLGKSTDETPAVVQKFESMLHGQYLFAEVPHREIGNYYAAADYLIQCSKKESFGFMYVEALSFDLSIITHDFPEVRYVLEDHGYFVDMDNPAMAAIRVGEIVNADKKSNHADFVEKKYSWEALAEDYTKMFKRIVA
jgi:glycosyltransferase involved in cell wall biosynthesis